jgi:hypothetical protein
MNPNDTTNMTTPVPTTPEAAIPPVVDSAQTLAAPAAAVPAPPATPATATAVPVGGTNNSKKIIMIAGAVLLVLLLIIGGVVFFLTVSPSEQAVSNPPQSEATVPETPSQLLEEAQGVDLGEVDGDLKDVDTDLNSL